MTKSASNTATTTEGTNQDKRTPEQQAADVQREAVNATERKLTARVAELRGELAEQVTFLRNTARRVHELGAEGRNIEVDVKTRADKLEKLTT